MQPCLLTSQTLILSIDGNDCSYFANEFYQQEDNQIGELDIMHTNELLR